MADNTPKIRRRSIADYSRDAHNANQGNPKGRQVLTDSFRQLGAGRSLLSDKDDTLIAGNQSLEAAKAAGITDVIEVETDGTALVIVKRTDLDLDTDSEARRLAYADNRTQELDLTWDAAQIAADAALLGDLFGADELAEFEQLAALDTSVDVQLAGEGDTAQGEKMPADGTVKAVLPIKDVGVFERALQKTGLRNRAEALIAVCRAYVGDV